LFAQLLRPSHKAAIAQALFVTLLWSTSWVLIKLGLQDLPALTFAGLRYTLAFLVLLPVTWRLSAGGAALKGIHPKDLGLLAIYGLLFVSVTQGAQFVGLALLPAATVSLLLNFSPVVVALFGVLLLAERPTPLQWLGVAVYIGGIIVYFAPSGLEGAEFAGVLVVLLAVAANAASSIVGRYINRGNLLNPLLITTISMGVGSAALLGAGILYQGLPELTATHWFYILWLAVVNTALAFPLWNSSLRTLTAVESSLINSTMLPQIALLAFLFLGESLSTQELVGMALVVVGVLWVQLRRRSARETRNAA
jgi:drug/metabolite transporter (DMT)-like permease